MSIIIFVKHNQLYLFLRRVAVLKEATLMVRQVVRLDGGRGAGDRVSLLKFVFEPLDCWWPAGSVTVVSH